MSAQSAHAARAIFAQSLIRTLSTNQKTNAVATFVRHTLNPAQQYQLIMMMNKREDKENVNGFNKLCDMSGQNLQWFLRAGFRSKSQDFCTLFDIIWKVQMQ